MNVFDEDDRRIEAIFKADIYEPDSYTQAIMNALSKSNKKKLTFNLSRLIAAIVTGIMIVSSIAYAEQIGEFILRFFNDNKGLDNAVENGYIKTVKEEFLSPSEIGMELEYILMDDNYLNFITSIKLNNSIYSSYKINKIFLEDTIISDDKDNILYCDDEQVFNEYCKNNNLNYEYLKFNLKYNDNTRNIRVLSSENSNNIRLSYNLYSNDEYPKSKRLYISINRLVLIMDNNEKIEITDNWQICVNLNDKFYNRQSKKYKFGESSNSIIKVTEFDVYNTGSTIELSAKLKSVFSDEALENLDEEKINEFKKWGLESINHIVEDVYIENSNGEIFYSANSSYDETKILYNYLGEFYYKNSFTLTQYDATDTLTVHFTLNTIDGSEDVVIKLERDN